MLYITSSIGGPKCEFDTADRILQWFNAMPPARWVVVWSKSGRRFSVIGRMLKDQFDRVVCDRSVADLLTEKKYRGEI